MGENAHRTVKELLEQNENSPLTLRLALTGLLPLEDSVSFHQQKILSIHFPCAALSVLQGNRNQKRSPWYVMDFRILTAVTSQRLLYRLRKKSKVFEKKKNFFGQGQKYKISMTHLCGPDPAQTYIHASSLVLSAHIHCHTQRKAHESVFAGSQSIVYKMQVLAKSN